MKVYWSEKSDAGSLKSDDSWKAYDETTTDKTKVRSVAFEFLDDDDNPALLAQDYYTYVLVKMKAPTDEDVTTIAYNNSHSEWNAIDNLTGEMIYNITGIESNTVLVLLSEKYDLTVQKNWVDYDDYYEIRPDSISINLLKDGKVIDTKTLDIKAVRRKWYLKT